MSALWIIPPVVVLSGLLLAAVVLRRLDEATARVRLQVVRVDDVRRQARAARAAADEAARAFDHLGRR
ncbi:MAG: hypothetical protein HYX34_13920 [Actinobacteria bacterium]|nr:hypothetical protein [Actinomycetota bacterium]